MAKLAAYTRRTFSMAPQLSAGPGPLPPPITPPPRHQPRGTAGPNQRDRQGPAGSTARGGLWCCRAQGSRTGAGQRGGDGPCGRCVAVRGAGHTHTMSAQHGQISKGLWREAMPAPGAPQPRAPSGLGQSPGPGSAGAAAWTCAQAGASTALPPPPLRRPDAGSSSTRCLCNRSLAPRASQAL